MCQPRQGQQAKPAAAWRPAGPALQHGPHRPAARSAPPLQGPPAPPSCRSRRYFSAQKGELGALRLSTSLEQTMWAASMVRSSAVRAALCCGAAAGSGSCQPPAGLRPGDSCVQCTAGAGRDCASLAPLPAQPPNPCCHAGPTGLGHHPLSPPTHHPPAPFQVRSRTFSEEVGGEGLTLMVPYADLANHSFSHNSNFMMGMDRKRWAATGGVGGCVAGDVWECGQGQGADGRRWAGGLPVRTAQRGGVQTAWRPAWCGPPS
jgi:hypothetical protein